MSLATELAAVAELNLAALRQKYAELFGDTTRTGNKPWLIKRIRWRLQALAEGGLSQRARDRADELANEADLRLSPPPERDEPPVQQAVVGSVRPTGVPRPGTILQRQYKGQRLEVRVLSNGFEYAGETYKSLSAVAKVITGSHQSGQRFFGLTGDNP